MSPEASLLILLLRRILKGELATTLEFLSSATLNLKKPLTILIQGKNLEREALASYTMVRARKQTQIATLFINVFLLTRKETLRVIWFGLILCKTQSNFRGFFSSILSIIGGNK
jgi:hypothetical protein